MIDAHAMLHLVLSKPVTSLVLALGLIPAGAARAGEFCADMNILVGRAQSNFPGLSAGTTDAEKPFLLPGAKTCAVTRTLSGSKAYHCAWEFAYRATAANDRFNAFDRSLRQCFGNRAQTRKDQWVNHPDFYDLRQYRLEQVDVSVSIKDKSAMQKTYVFIRVQGANVD